MFTSKTGLIIPTRNRPKYLLRTLKYFKINKIKFFKIVVIDSSDLFTRNKIIKICKKYKTDLYFCKPSTSNQRNLGLQKLNKYKLKFIMFLDDDLKFYKNSFVIMDLNIRKNKDNFIGFCFNNTKLAKNSFLEKIKVSKFAQNLGLYSSICGRVLNSGWHTKIENLQTNLKSQWLPTSCVIYKKNLIKDKFFDMSFGNYSYLEDLDFSLQINPNRRLCFLAISDAKFLHSEEVIRTSFTFGYYEFINRYKIVKKFNLDKLSFFFMSIFKIALTTLSIFSNYKNTFKLLGNFTGLFKCIRNL